MTLNAKSILLGVSLLTAGAAFNGWWFAWTLGGEIRAVGEKMDRLLEAQERSTDRLLKAQEASTERLLRAQESSTKLLLNRLDGIQDTLGEIQHTLDGMQHTLDGMQHTLDGIQGTLDGMQGTLGVIREDQIRILERTPDGL